jgi:two-component sensor histidine kinase
MNHPGSNLDERKTARRIAEIFDAHQHVVHRRTDRMFAGLMVLQWLAGVAAALWVSPKAWAGATSYTHPHVWAALFLGGAISALPILLAVTRPGHLSTRYTVAVGQMLMGALLIHLTGGRIETHFHVFGSLAFLSFYRDWRVLIPATIVVAADHLLRGVFWPQSVYGVLTASEWRWLEHAGWVIFEVTFLLIAMRHSIGEMRRIAERTAEIESLNEGLEAHVANRTEQLVAANHALEQEVAERKLAESELAAQRAFLQQALEQIKTALHEKEVLLKEIHHRVKNNMQVITSLLNLQSKSIGDAQALSVFQDSQNRVKSMALIHETLYQSKDLSHINFAEYLEKLVAHVSRSYRIRPEAVKINTHVDQVSLPIDTAVPCGLIINELASNSLKYAFPSEARGEINISFVRDDAGYVLRVSDTGVGLPEGFDPERGKSLGMKLVRMLTGQLGGELAHHNGVGTTFEIRFPEERLEVRA